MLGFEYGYSLAEPNALTLWEAQFGDFANGAQVVFDQFISSGERKWLRMSGLVCLLPHGYEGQGPEHSSARLERFLQMCAEDNMQVANCTTPANYFHILRRQLKRDIRKPLILMTPKSLLRHKRAVSRLDEMGPDTSFHRLLWDDAQALPDEKIKLVPDNKIRRVVMCSGKVYFDLYEEREKRGVDDIYLLRVEQLYPLPMKALMHELVALQAGGDRVVPGRAAQHGRVALRRAVSRMGAQPDRRHAEARALCRPAAGGGDRGRRDVEAPRAAQGDLRRRACIMHRSLRPDLSRRTRRIVMAEIRVPTLGESVTEATIGKWFKKPGDAVAVDEPLVELETDKVTIEVPAPAAGMLPIAAKDGDTVAVGALLGQIEEGLAAAQATERAAPRDSPPRRPHDQKTATTAPINAARGAGAAQARGAAKADAPVAPSVRKMAAESGIDPSTVPGSGKDGRVTKGDMMAAIERAAARRRRLRSRPSAVQVRAPLPQDDAAREERVKMTRLRQTIARRLKDAQNTAAMLTTFNEVDMSAVMAMRTQYHDLFEKKHGVKLGFMGFFVRACVQALQEIPAVNAEIDGADIIYKNYYHIGIAVGTERASSCRWCATAIRNRWPRSRRRSPTSAAARATARSRSRRCRAAPSPSPTAASTAR